MPNLVNLGLDPNGRNVYMTPRMRAAFDLTCDRAGVVPTIVQGAYMTLNGGGAAASAGYHDKAGCIDTRVWNLTVAQQDAVIREGRSVGWAIWLRDHRHGMDPHMHWVLGGEPDMAAGAAWQWQEYLADRDGLASRGPDYHWRPNPIRTFNEEDDMPLSDQDIDKLTNQLMRRQIRPDGLTVAGALRRASFAADLAKLPAQLAEVKDAVDRNADKGEIKRMLEGIEAEIHVVVTETEEPS